ncbi:MAG: hypothetical protein ABEK84_02410 [Salinibacter sp.]
MRLASCDGTRRALPESRRSCSGSGGDYAVRLTTREELDGSRRRHEKLLERLETDPSDESS